MSKREYKKFPEPKECSFTQSWCTDLEKSAIQFALAKITNSKHRFIEIGCFEGRSTVFTANLLHPQVLIAVDPWIPVANAGMENELYQTYDIEQTFLSNIRIGTEGNVDVRKMKWETYFEENNEEKISYLYLDGPHSYDNVYKSLETIVPLMCEGGVLIGDDYEDRAVKSAVDDFFKKDMTHPLSYRTFIWENK